jgi:hypothetical protein
MPTCPTSCSTRRSVPVYGGSPTGAQTASWRLRAPHFRIGAALPGPGPDQGRGPTWQPRSRSTGGPSCEAPRPDERSRATPAALTSVPARRATRPAAPPRWRRPARDERHSRRSIWSLTCSTGASARGCTRTGRRGRRGGRPIPVRSVEAVDKSLPHAAAPADDRQVEDRAPCGAEEVGAIFASWLAERYPGARWVIEPGKERRATGLRPDRGRSSGRSAARRTRARSRSGAPCWR